MCLLYHLIEIQTAVIFQWSFLLNCSTNLKERNSSIAPCTFLLTITQLTIIIFASLGGSPIDMDKLKQKLQRAYLRRDHYAQLYYETKSELEDTRWQLSIALNKIKQLQSAHSMLNHVFVFYVMFGCLWATIQNAFNACNDIDMTHDAHVMFVMIFTI